MLNAFQGFHNLEQIVLLCETHLPGIFSLVTQLHSFLVHFPIEKGALNLGGRVKEPVFQNYYESQI